MARGTNYGSTDPAIGPREHVVEDRGLDMVAPAAGWEGSRPICRDKDDCPCSDSEEAMVKRVLFVCEGNIHRSRTAEVLYGDTPGLEVRSAGLANSARVQ